MNNQIPNHPAHDLIDGYINGYKKLNGTNNIYYEKKESGDLLKFNIAIINIDERSNLIIKTISISFKKDANSINKWVMKVENVEKIFNKIGVQMKEMYHEAEYLQMSDKEVDEIKRKLNSGNFDLFLPSGIYASDFEKLSSPGLLQIGHSLCKNNRYVIFEPLKNNIGLVSRKETVYRGDSIVKENSCIEVHGCDDDPRILLFSSEVQYHNSFPVLEYENIEQNEEGEITSLSSIPYISSLALGMCPGLTVENMNEYFLKNYISRLQVTRGMTNPKNEKILNDLYSIAMRQLKLILQSNQMQNVSLKK